MHPRIAIPQPRSNADEYNQRSLPQYLHAIEHAGGEPLVIELSWSNAEIARAASQCDAICLPGSGADIGPEKYGAKERHPQTAEADPARDNVDELLLQDAYNMRKPVLAICYGVQSLNVWRTGALIQHIESKFGILHEAGRAVPRAHTVNVNPHSWILGRLAEPICHLAMHDREDGRLWRKLNNGELRGWVNSSHHQAVETAGDGLLAVAKADDGIIEAIESTSHDHWVLGVQWHPERGYDEDELSKAMFRGFIQAAWERRGNPRNDTVDFETISH
ncbi:MAG TPA: gamma-glutamyl-gamma-aminobutyrate hydrolase family protein [Terriglobales bacterium]|nr:gamma-glutamyl-gamma-aminobutyrate hydrolase family protein [Terriglobales bacterium]